MQYFILKSRKFFGTAESILKMGHDMNKNVDLVKSAVGGCITSFEIGKKGEMSSTVPREKN